MTESRWKKLLPKYNEDDSIGVILKNGRRKKKRKKRRKKEIEEGTKNLILYQQSKLVVI